MLGGLFLKAMEGHPKHMDPTVTKLASVTYILFDNHEGLLVMVAMNTSSKLALAYKSTSQKHVE